MIHLVLRHPENPLPERQAPFRGWLVLAVAVASLLILVLGWHIYESHRFFGHIGTEFVRRTEAITEFRALRWEMTQATHHVVLFGSGEDWRKAYDDASRRLTAALDADLDLQDQPQDRASFSSVAADAAGRHRDRHAVGLPRQTVPDSRRPEPTATGAGQSREQRRRCNANGGATEHRAQLERGRRR